MPFFTQEEWRAFWIREYTTLLRTATVLSGNQVDAEDAVHEAFLSLDQAVGRGRAIEPGKKTPEEAVRAYLLTVVRNHVMNLWRKRYRGKQVSGVGVLQQPAQGNLNPQQQLPLLSVQKLAERLPPRERELLEFLLAHVDENPDEYWTLWAEQHGLHHDDQTARNTFDQLRGRLRRRLRELGV